MGLATNVMSYETSAQGMLTDKGKMVPHALRAHNHNTDKIYKILDKSIQTRILIMKIRVII
jgi:hypothetical protein